LSADGGVYGGHLSHRCGDCEVSGPAEESAVDERSLDSSVVAYKDVSVLYASHTGPPFNKPAVKDTAKASHEHCVFVLNATVGKKLMNFWNIVSAASTTQKPRFTHI